MRPGFKGASPISDLPGQFQPRPGAFRTGEIRARSLHLNLLCDKSMKWSTKFARRPPVRGIVLMVVMTLALVGAVCSQLNFSYQDHEKLAALQARLGTLGTQKTEPAGPEPPTIVGHRGLGLRAVGESDGLLIGNTANAINRGIRAEVDWVEIDLRRAKDNKLVLFHDKTIEAKTTGTGSVSEMEVQELQACDLKVDPPEKILTLEDFENLFLKTFTVGGVGLILDIKEENLSGLVLKWLKTAKSKGLRSKSIIIFGDYEILKEYRGSGYKLGYTLLASKSANKSLFLFRRAKIIKRLEEIGADMLILPVIFANKVLVQEARDKDFDTWVYGSEDERDWEEVVHFGARGLIVDTPEHAVLHFRPRA
jgi:glycerophosphoryl diester phosphodiesterase